MLFVYVVYPDVLFFINSVMDFILLRLVNKITHGQGNVLRSAAGAIVGSAGFCIVIVLVPGSVASVVAAHVVINTLMVKIGCGPKSPARLLQDILCLYLVSFLTGGMLQFVVRLTGQTGMWIFFATTVLTYLILSVVTGWLERSVRRTAREYKVCLNCDGKTMECKALLDTGNSLRDIFRNRPVNFGSMELFEELFQEKEKKHLLDFWNGKDNGEDIRKMEPHFITFTGMGCSGGLALVITLDYLLLEGRQTHRVISRPVMAFSRENRSFGEGFQVILHPDLISNQEG